MTEKDFPFTEEQIQKHLRFLTKEDIETSIEDLRNQPHPYHHKEELLNTDRLDKKLREYLAEGRQLREKVNSRGEIFFKLNDLIICAQKNIIAYTPTEPAEKDPNTFYITDETLRINGQQLKHAKSFIENPGHYFYTGSIENKTDSGLVIAAETGNALITLAYPEDQVRINYQHKRQNMMYDYFATSLDPVDGQFIRSEDRVNVLVSYAESKTIYMKDLDPNLGHTCFWVSEYPNSTYIYGDFFLTEGEVGGYSPCAVQVEYDSPEHRAIKLKIVGEFMHDFFSECLSYSPEEDRLDVIYNIEPNQISTAFSFTANHITKLIFLDEKKIKNYGLDKVKNSGPEHNRRLIRRNSVEFKPGVDGELAREY